MDLDFPLTAEQVLGSVAAMALVIAVACAIAKQWLKDWRWLNLVALAFGWTLAAGATLVVAQGKPTPAQWFTAFLLGLFSTALATLGYETLTNILGLLGIGKRAT